MEFDIYGPHLNPNGFGDPPAIHLAQQIKDLSCVVKFLNTYWMNWHNIWYRHSQFPYNVNYEVMLDDQPVCLQLISKCMHANTLNPCKHDKLHTCS